MRGLIYQLKTSHIPEISTLSPFLSLTLYLFQVLEFGEADRDRERERESNKCKMKEKKLMETEELNFLLQSGIVLCKLAAIIVPGADIVVDQLQVVNFWKYFIYWFSTFLRRGICLQRRKTFTYF